MKQIISLQIEDSLINELKIIAEQEDMSVSALIRKLIKKFLQDTNA